MAETKSKSQNKAGKDTSNVKDASDVDTKVLLASSNTKGNNMSEDNNSLLTFSEDVASAEAPVPLPVGEYPAEIRAAERKISGAGNPYGSVQFFIAPEAYPADYIEGEPDGMLLTYNRVSVADTPAGRHRLRKFVEAIGAKGGTEINMNDWIGLTAVVSVSHDTYEGETRAAIAKVNPA